MSKPKFTPGPWEMFYFTQHELQTDFAMVKIGKRAHMIGHLEEDCANANLIAAAPDLYYALDKLFEVVTGDIPVGLSQVVYEALAKSRGEA